jgi:methylase of polypeptide subunit release factors
MHTTLRRIVTPSRVGYGRGAMADMTTCVDATAYLAPLPRRRVRRPVRLRLTDDSYPLEPTPEQSWLPVAFRAFAELDRRMHVEDLLILGTGNGLDALGAAEIFDLRALTVTDLHASSLSVARENVIAHLMRPAGMRLDFRAGDLLSCVPPGQRFSLVYENLPNLPATPAVDLRRGTLGGRFFDASALEVPALFGAYRLALHHQCLLDARPHLRDGGGVLTAIGGRMPHDVAFGLHRACGYRPRLVAFDVKLQVEPELVVPPYRRAEAEHGVPFTFYAPEAIALVADARRDGLDGASLADAVAADLDRLSLSAREADQRVAAGRAVAHSVLMIFGERDPPGAPPAGEGELSPRRGPG